MIIIKDDISHMALIANTQLLTQLFNKDVRVYYIYNIYYSYIIFIKYFTRVYFSYFLDNITCV